MLQGDQYLDFNAECSWCAFQISIRKSLRDYIALPRDALCLFWEN